ncbi:uncharacterized protein EI97DRAFT_368402 [Westerdykella ornata]|uniref:Uncharacterized protein n=1 Tax=Westerdykella ornata TaxID=318751 RepID=A0A6A6JVG9_WESOR|nr:uncharacterized protein EI97DRAFT_368402 [Westerdykella ornata]KAF2280600.1 hypothetical protein EI97DRAFT_368402 [Westerdykella ornata]
MILSAPPLYYQNPFMFHRRSPLAEVPANAAPRPLFSTMASQPQLEQEKQTVPQRTHKPNPVMQSREATTQRRRDMFFRRLQKDRDDQRWHARGEQIQKLDWISEQKRWEAQKTREAPELKDDVIEELVTESALEASSAPSFQSNEPRTERDIAEAEYILAQEERELQELIAAMEEEQRNGDDTSEHYGSDDDDYDEIFMRIAVGDAGQASPGAPTFESRDPDAMDMTAG